MTAGESHPPIESPELVLPLTLFSRYLQFLARRPISESNLHYRATRVAGLRSLIPVLAAAPQPEIARVSEQLRRLTPTNLVRLAPEMHRTLRAFREPQLPRVYRSLDTPPDTTFFSGVRRVLVLIGPAIGIGDEIITFPLPRALQSLISGGHVTVASAYPQVWDRVDGVDEVQHYADLNSLVNKIRSGHFDLLLLVDFENPALTNAICHEPNVTRYMELALGPRQLLALDRRRLLQWRMPLAEPNFQNYYDCVEGMCRWLGTPPEIETGNLMPVSARPLPEHVNELVIFVNPFTSKEDPSERYWAELLCSAIPASVKTPIRMLINTGPSLTTRSLALGLARKVEAHYVGRSLRVEVPHQPGKPGSILGIGDIFRYSDEADLILTADSFPAHAAQIFRRLTVVLGKPRTEPWRSPSGSSFYFNSLDSLSSVARSIQTLLSDILTHPSASARDTMQAHAMRSAMDELHVLLQARELTSQTADQLRHCWASLRASQERFLEQVAVISPTYNVLFSDSAYGDLLPGLDSVPQSDLIASPEVLIHLGRRFREWKNSNLPKYLLRIEGASSPPQTSVSS